MKGHIKDKQYELIWALSEPEQGYTLSEIGNIMNNMPRSTVYDIVKKKPKGWLCPWVKRT